MAVYTCNLSVGGAETGRFPEIIVWPVQLNQIALGSREMLGINFWPPRAHAYMHTCAQMCIYTTRAHYIHTQ